MSPPPRSTLFPYTTLFRSGVEHFFGESLKMNPHILEDMEHMPFWLGQLPFIMMVLGFAVSYFFYVSRPDIPEELADRKSTRLNSSHGYISYAVFCLKKKKK